MRRPFSKPALSYNDQIDLLKSRGMVIADEAKAEHLLAYTSYYRMSGYWHPLVDIPKENHQFKPGASFETAFQLYCFDRDLRKLVAGELEKVEIAVRAKMTYHLSHAIAPCWYAEPSAFSNSAVFTQTLGKIVAEYRRSDEEFIQAFKANYVDDHPPSWIMMEVVSFGTISFLYKNIANSYHRRLISKEFGLDENTFESWLHTLVYVRNVCAHHARLWNRVLRITPSIPRRPGKAWLTVQAPNNRVFYLLSMVIYLKSTISPNSRFQDKFRVLTQKYPQIDLTAMGFPNGWECEAIWQ